MNIQPEQSVALFKALAAQIPKHVETSSVVLVEALGKTVRQLGSGTLVALAEKRFVVTAAHVILEAQRKSSTLGVGVGTAGNFVAVTGDWTVSEALFDIAVYELKSDQINQMKGCSYIRIADVAFNSDLSNALFVVTGFPSVWASPSGSEDEVVALKHLQYWTYSYDGPVNGFDGYSDRYHFLLHAKPEELLGSDGKQFVFKGWSGFSARLPEDLKGISGCAVWRVGDIRAPASTWSPEDVKLVGVETGIFKTNTAIKVTRWALVTTLLYQTVPEVRPVIELYDKPQP